MFVNATKTTIPAFKIAISWNNEEGYIVINKIITLFKWMRVNAIFEPIEIAGKNYQKFIQYGIDENNLKHLKQNNILLHTSFDYSYFNTKTQMMADIYLDIALKNYAIKFFQNGSIRVQATKFLTQNMKYIQNIDEIIAQYKIDIENNKIDNSLTSCDFFISFGEKYNVFCINNFTTQSVKNFTIQLLEQLNLIEQLIFLKSCESIDEAIEKMKKNKNIAYQMSICDEIKRIPIEWRDMHSDNVDALTNIETNLSGMFKICDLVDKIKTKKIKLPEEYELYQIYCNNIEYYPNINFWNEIVINPTIKIRKIEINKIGI